VFVGHGLKQDFRMLNLSAPPTQVRDTVELWRLPRHRKLSLRFLAAYVLGETIQVRCCIGVCGCLFCLFFDWFCSLGGY
jgi:hypothetical protein